MRSSFDGRKMAVPGLGASIEFNSAILCAPGDILFLGKTQLARPKIPAPLKSAASTLKAESIPLENILETIAKAFVFSKWHGVTTLSSLGVQSGLRRGYHGRLLKFRV
jgi:hypothetical protein